ncbi:ankyrin repeat-containing domain protein [Apodospora peruviana]|uniref:Ankyrin repeat-containing domain protein n=1 Tax=Apodospora peruviana TaxID=516989 RepID=A0AAE0HX51_9PEZI|nr:ankyrin repeat-containing domain protein [Apodospora peruviana]
MASLTRLGALRALLTGRPHIQDDITRHFQQFLQLEIRAGEDDLREYVYHELDRYGVCMFLLSVLQLRTVVDAPTIGEMQEILAALYNSPSQAYLTTLSRVQNLPGSRSKLGMSILQWVCYSERPLEFQELRDILSIQDGQTKRDDRYKPSLTVILECYQGLVLVDKESKTGRLAHYTCLEYLSLDVFQLSGPLDSWWGIQKRIDDYPCLPYAACNWHAHVRKLDADHHLEAEEVIMLFLSSQTLRGTTEQISSCSEGYGWQYCQSEECLTITGLHLACWGGLEKIVAKLLAENSCPSVVNARSYIGSTPIAYAAGPGYEKIVQILLAHESDPYIENTYGNAMHCTAEAGRVDVIRVLVQQAGMAPGLDQQYSRLPVECTLDHDHAEAFRTLIDLGASVHESWERTTNSGLNGHGDGTHELGMTFLHLAAQNGAANVINVIIEENLMPDDIDARCAHGTTALHLAAGQSRIEAMIALLEAGADECADDDCGRTPKDPKTLFPVSTREWSSENSTNRRRLPAK